MFRNNKASEKKKETDNEMKRKSNELSEMQIQTRSRNKQRAMEVI